MMMLDIRHTQSGDVDLSSGDLEIAEATAQHQRDLLTARPGQNREFPLVGVDSVNYMSDHERAPYLRNIRKQFSRDGMTVKKIYFSTAGLLVIDAEYERN